MTIPQSPLAARQADVCLELVPRVVGALKILVGSHVTTVDWEGRRYSVAQLKILWLMAQQPDLSMAQIARELSLRTPTVTHHVNGLVKHRLLKRGSAKGDKRLVALELTPEGRRLVQWAMARYRDYLAALMSHFPEATLRRLPAALRDVIALLEPVTKSMDPGAIYHALLAAQVGKEAPRR